TGTIVQALFISFPHHAAGAVERRSPKGWPHAALLVLHYPSIRECTILTFLRWSFFSVVLAAVSFGQTRDTAAVFGVVSDSQGAAIPGATVTITNTATGQLRKLSTNESGQYLFTSLP